MSFRFFPTAMAKLLLAFAVMLAVPVQGFAASSMLLCGKMSQSAQAGAKAQASASGHQMAQGHHHDAAPSSQAMPADGSHHGQADTSDGGSAQHGKCSTCAACCMGVAIVGALFPAMSPSVGSMMIPFTQASLADHTPKGLDPPPRRFLA